ncbi:MAG: hypothetical protein WCO94_12635 [Verrucomicrobiota bacterium]
MTTQDEQDLREMQAKLVSAEQSPWQPRCVARAFRSSDEAFVFTMQTWIDLDAAASPFLLGQLPEAEQALAQFEVAFAAFGHVATTPEACEPEELILLGRKMLVEIGRGFAMRLQLAPPEGCKLAGGDDNGLGNWLPILACLKSQLGFSLAEALSLTVGQAFALVAAHRCNEGWSIAGETYQQRDIPEEGDDHA